MAWNPATDPFYRALLADIADTEWQIVEVDFLAAVGAGAIADGDFIQTPRGSVTPSPPDGDGNGTAAEGSDLPRPL